MIYDKDILKKFIDYYFSEKNHYIISQRKLAKKFNTSRGIIITIIDYFVECGYLYRDGNRNLVIYKTKQNFNPIFYCQISNNYIKFFSSNVNINLSRFEMSRIVNLKDFKHEISRNDAIYWLFYFHFEFNTRIHTLFYLDNNSCAWLKKACYYSHSSNPLYFCEFTQQKKTITLWNN